MNCTMSALVVVLLGKIFGMSLREPNFLSIHLTTLSESFKTELSVEAKPFKRDQEEDRACLMCFVESVNP